MSKKPVQREPSQRQLRVSETLRAGLSDIFIRGVINDPELDGAVITVAEVRVSPDLKAATAYVMPLGGNRQKQILEALTRHSRFVRGELASRVTLKHMPAVTFELDDTFEQSSRVDDLLRSARVAQDLD